jgi:hypothetical protein
MEMLGIDAKHTLRKTQEEVTISWEGKEKYLDTLRAMQRQSKANLAPVCGYSLKRD